MVTQVTTRNNHEEAGGTRGSGRWRRTEAGEGQGKRQPHAGELQMAMATSLVVGREAGEAATMAARNGGRGEADVVAGEGDSSR